MYDGKPNFHTDNAHSRIFQLYTSVYCRRKLTWAVLSVHQIVSEMVNQQIPLGWWGLRWPLSPASAIDRFRAKVTVRISPTYITGILRALEEVFPCPVPLSFPLPSCLLFVYIHYPLPSLLSFPYFIPFPNPARGSRAVLWTSGVGLGWTQPPNYFWCIWPRMNTSSDILCNCISLKWTNLRKKSRQQ